MRNPNLVQRRRLRRVRWFLLVFVVAETAANLLANAIFTFVPSGAGEYVGYLQLMLIEIVAFLSAFMVYSRMGTAAEAEYEGRSSMSDALRMNPIKPSVGLLIFLLGLAGELVMVLLNIPACRIFGVSGGEKLTVIDFAVGIIAMAVFPAFLEELMFRGLIFSVFERESARTAIIFTGVTFALLHHGYQFILGNLFLGLTLAIILYKTNSIYAAMLYHFTSNLFALVIDFTGLFAISEAGLEMLFAGAVLAFIWLMSLLLKIFKERKITKSKNDFGVIAENIFSLPVILCILIMIFYSSIVNILT